MKRTLVTLLGRAQKQEHVTGYEEATYRFPDGKTYRRAFIGLALAHHLEPHEVVILGTAGSQWSALVEDLAGQGGEYEEARLELMSAEEAKEVGRPMLDRLAPLMGEAMNAAVRPILIGTGADERQQYAILEAVNNAVVYDGELHFDLTHGFRHLGMVGFLSSFMLERVRDLNVRKLWYGQFDAESRVADVLPLDGLMHVRRWLDALNRFDAAGDYGIFAPLLREDGVPEDKARCLEDAAFYERTLNVRDAARKIGTFLPVLDGPLPGASGLFKGRLRGHLRWAQEQALSEQQRELADLYLDRGDFLRAAMFGLEACISRICEESGVAATANYDERQSAIRERLFKKTDSRRRDYVSLSKLRNAMAHAGDDKDWERNRSTLTARDKLSSELRRTMRSFFG